MQVLASVSLVWQLASHHLSMMPENIERIYVLILPTIFKHKQISRFFLVNYVCTLHTLKDSVRDTSLSRLCGLKSCYYKLILFKLLQILYLLGVGLLMTFDLLACVDSTGMLYHNSAKFWAKVLHRHILYMYWCLYWSLGNLYPGCVSSVIRCITFQIKSWNLYPMSTGNFICLRIQLNIMCILNHSALR